ncbi:MAG: bifunctional glutamate--cysteine ligase GshA/glutathione synthetase GshB [Clostridium sp.]
MIQENLVRVIREKKLLRYLEYCNFGLEKENVRVDKNGKIATTHHPEGLGDKDKNPYIQRDFAESQVEMITPVCNTIDEVYNFMDNLNKLVIKELRDDEYLWPQSNPPMLPSEEEIKIASFSNEEFMKYREGLAKRYGRKRQVIAGVHYNFSFKEEFIGILYNELKIKEDYREFKDKLYFKIARNFLKYSWILVYLTGASPVFHKTYIDKCANSAKKIGDEDYIFPGSISLRNSKCGYKNKVNYYVSYNNPEEYVDSLQGLVKNGYLSSAKEYYNPIRIKSLGEGDQLNNIIKRGVDYLEVRMLDLDPLEMIGIKKDDLYLIHGFMIYMLLKEDEEMTEEVQRDAYINKEITSIRGRCDCTNIYWDGEERNIRELGEEILIKVTTTLEGILGSDNVIVMAVSDGIKKINDSKSTKAYNVLSHIEEESYIDFHMNMAKEYKNSALSTSYTLSGYEDLELSTQILILEAMKKGIKVDILDRKENFISLEYNNKKQYVKQATKTSLDSYITALIMENKLVSKVLLNDAGVRVPKGRDYDDAMLAKSDYDFFSGKSTVIKPKSTNFGIGITIFKREFSEQDFSRAIDIAFKEDNSILIEEFIEGKEYRFLVIGDKVEGILHRVPANIVGDGRSTIRELVVEKNNDPLRGKGYKTPLEKIGLGESEEMFLSQSNKTFDYIPNKDEVVYLRENSNISTGGDSIDFTDEINVSYKEIAIKAAKSVGAVITGVDVMISDINKEAREDNHAIIEVNFNPAIHIHSYPYKGKNRKIAEKILNLLF